MAAIIACLALAICWLVGTVSGHGLLWPDDYYEKFNVFGEPKHTLTKYKDIGEKCGIGSNMEVVKSGPLKEEEQRQFVEAHNAYRRKVAKGEESGGADSAKKSIADMMEMSWDEELAEIAQRWAEQCPDSAEPHDENRQVDVWPWVGQNVHIDSEAILSYHSEIASSFDKIIDKVIRKWSQDSLHFSHKESGPFSFSNDTKYYAQLVWGSSRRLGCGVFIIRGKTYTEETKNKYYVYVVCNYGPGGNVNGAQMYEHGVPGSKCRPGTFSNDGLCSVKCLEDEFFCESGKCINSENVCDETVDCPNGEDEANCDPAPERKKRCVTAYELKCNKTGFECSDGNCIPLAWRCDGIPDCKEKDDERNCDSLKCGPHNYECFSGGCINTKLVCNGKKDCKEGDEEANCYENNCGENKYKCFGGVCIDLYLKCNGIRDCIDGDDETHCYSVKCGRYKFECATGKCIRKYRLCDGTPNCDDGEDERNCFKLITKPTRPEEQVGYNKECDEHSVCKTTGASCVNGRCQCDSSTAYHDKGAADECLKIAKNINDRCVCSVQCTSLLGTKLSIHCSKVTGKCACKGGYVFNKKTNSCTLQEEIEYNKPCRKSMECKTVNAACVNGTCQCEASYIYVSGSVDACLKIAPKFGSICEADIQCYSTNFGDASSAECSPGGICMCKENFTYHKTNKRCLPLPKRVPYDHSCDSTSICLTIDAACIGGKCLCPKTHVYNKGDHYDECLPIATKLGSECISDLQCNSFALGVLGTVECSASTKRCICNKNAVYNDFQQLCIMKETVIAYKGKCGIYKRCGTYGSSCINGKCECNSTAVYHDKGVYDECLLVAQKVGDHCFVDAQCTASSFGDNSSVVCYKPIEKCICKVGYGYDKNAKVCKSEKKLIVYNGTCTNDSVCVTNGAQCVEGRCLCPEDYVYHNAQLFDECLNIALNIGDQCTIDEQCSLSIRGNAESIYCSQIYGKCLCKSGFTYHTGEEKCLSVSVHQKYKQSCSRDYDCATVGSICKSEQCSCPASSVYHDRGYFDECLVVKKGIGDTCEIDLQCTLSSFGTDTSVECSKKKGICICKVGYTYNKKEFKCTKIEVRHGYNGTCTNTSECVTLNSKCIDEVCACDANTLYYDNGFYDQCIKIAANISDPCIVQEQCTNSSLGSANSIECSTDSGRCLCKTGFMFSVNKKECIAKAKQVGYSGNCNHENICATQGAQCINGTCKCEDADVYHNVGYYDECLSIATNIGDKCLVEEQCTFSTIGNSKSITCTNTTNRCLCREGHVYHTSEKQCRKQKIHSKYRQSCLEDSDCVTINAICIQNLCACNASHVYHDVWFYDQCLKIATHIGESCSINLQCALAHFGSANTSECSKSRGRCVCTQGYTYNVIKEKCIEKEHLRGFADSCTKDSECITKGAKCLSWKCSCDIGEVYHSVDYFDDCLKFATKIGDPCVVDQQCTVSGMGDGYSIECYTPIQKCICRKGYKFNSVEERCKKEVIPKEFGEECVNSTDCITTNAVCNRTCNCADGYLHNTMNFRDECLKIATAIGEQCDVSEQCTRSVLGTDTSIECSTVYKCICKTGYLYDRSQNECVLLPVIVGFGKTCKNTSTCATTNAVCIQGTCSCPADHLYHNTTYSDHCLKIINDIGGSCTIDKQCTMSSIGNETTIYCNEANRCFCKKGSTFHTSENKCLEDIVPKKYKESCTDNKQCATLYSKCINGKCICDNNHIYNDRGFYDECLKIASYIGDSCDIDLQCILGNFGENISSVCSQRLKICMCREGYPFNYLEMKCESDDAVDKTMVNDTLEKFTSQLNNLQKRMKALSSILPINETSNCTVLFTPLMGKCYFIATQKLNWLPANTMCRRWGGHMVSIHSETENDALFKYLMGLPDVAEVWSGGYDVFAEGVFIWEKTHRPFQYTSWKYREPSGGYTKKTVFMRTVGNRLQWYAGWYSTRKYFMCERDKEYYQTQYVEENTAPGTKIEDYLKWFDQRLTDVQQSVYEFTSPLPINKKTNCPYGFVRLRDRCYFFDEYKGSWKNMNHYCKLWGASFLTIDSSEEVDTLVDYMQANIDTRRYWTSATSMHDQETYIWQTTKKIVDSAMWPKGEPIVGVDRCAYISAHKKPDRSATFATANCYTKCHILCERPLEVSEEQTLSRLIKISMSRKVKINTTLENFRTRLADLSWRVANLFPSMPFGGDTCPHGFVKLLGKCYYFSTFIYPWEVAGQYCRDWGSFLAQIDSAEENNAIANHFKGLKVLKPVAWIGAHDMLELGFYIWDGSQFEIDFTAWATGQPVSNANSGCTYIENGKWKKADCTDNYIFICEAVVI